MTCLCLLSLFFQGIVCKLEDDLLCWFILLLAGFMCSGSTVILGEIPAG